MRVLILGSTGFIGNHLYKSLNIENYEVIKITTAEFNNNDLFVSILRKTDILINCIGSANVGKSFIQVETDYESNVSIVKRILDTINRFEFYSIKFINLSSAAVYGNPIKLPISEKEMCNPISPYGFHKFISEVLIREYCTCYGVKAVSLRIFSVYGEGQKKLLLWDINQKIILNEGVLTFFGTGEETRDYIHIDDMVQQLILVIKNASFVGESINIANGVETRISDILHWYKLHHPIPFEYKFLGTIREGDPKNWRADISRILNWGYKSQIKIEHGIKNYINWVTVSK